jgi:hypothetical protein
MPVGEVRSYLANLANWQKTRKNKGKPGMPGATDRPTLYQGSCSLELESRDLHARFVQLKIYDGQGWWWVNYPVKCRRYFEQSRCEEAWEHKSPLLVLRPHAAAVRDHSLDQQHYRHLRRIAKKQWQSGKPVKGEHSNQQLRGHMCRMNEDAAHKVARSIATVCARYPGCVLPVTRLRKIKAKAGKPAAR